MQTAVVLNRHFPDLDTADRLMRQLAPEEVKFLNRINESIKKELPYTKPNVRVIEQYKGFQNIDYKKHNQR